MPVGESEYLGNRFGGAGQGDGVRLVHGEPFVTGVFLERGGFKKNFAGQDIFEPAENLDFCGNHSGGMLPLSAKEAEK